MAGPKSQGKYLARRNEDKEPAATKDRWPIRDWFILPSVNFSGSGLISVAANAAKRLESTSPILKAFLVKCLLYLCLASYSG